MSLSLWLSCSLLVPSGNKLSRTFFLLPHFLLCLWIMFFEVNALGYLSYISVFVICTASTSYSAPK